MGKSRRKIADVDTVLSQQQITATADLGIGIWETDQHLSDDPATDLYVRYQDVCSDVLQLKNSFESMLPPDRRKSLRMYRPKLGKQKANIPVPPVAARYTLIVREVSSKTFESELWTWVESEDLDGLYRVGSMTVEKAAPQVRAWSAYFGDIVSQWVETRILPDTPGHWEVVGD